MTRKVKEGFIETGGAIGDVDARVGVYEGHLGFLVVVFVVHVVDDVHSLVIDAGNLGEHHLVVSHHLLKVEHVAAQNGDAFHHHRTGVFATTAVDGERRDRPTR